MPISELEARLAEQLEAKSVSKYNYKEAARKMLMARGHCNKDGVLTKAGLARQALGADGRAKDRAAKYSHRQPADFDYDPKTNAVKVKDGA